MKYSATLGLVDVHYVDPDLAMDDFEDLWGTEELKRIGRYDGLRVVRLTELGAGCIGNLTATCGWAAVDRVRSQKVC